MKPPALDREAALMEAYEVIVRINGKKKKEDILSSTRIINDAVSALNTVTVSTLAYYMLGQGEVIVSHPLFCCVNMLPTVRVTETMWSLAQLNPAYTRSYREGWTLGPIPSDIPAWFRAFLAMGRGAMS